MVHAGLKLRQVEALWELARSALINQSEFFSIINQDGAAGVLEACQRKGVLDYSKPPRSEMNLELMRNQEYMTPTTLFYTFSQGTRPSVDIKKWQLSIGGDGVEKPLVLSYDDLLKLPYHTEARYLECAGNGRIFYDIWLNRVARGEPWHLGGWGLAEWTGVRLAEILKKAGIKNEAVEVMPVGMDSPSHQRPLPVSKAMEEDTLLAYIMNGRVLTADHGFPLRALVPGWVGVASVKWLNQIVVSTTPNRVTSNTTSYVLKGPDYKGQPPAKGPALTVQNVKSACCLAWPAKLKAGPQKVVGYAWSPFGKIARVEVSLDMGKTFKPATLSGPNIERAGSRWEFSFEAVRGEMTLMPRATDSLGNSQNDLSQQKWNEFGYVFGASVPHPVIISENQDALEAYCCHDHSDGVLFTGCC